jgi:hypothetical protein
MDEKEEALSARQRFFLFKRHSAYSIFITS